MTSNYSAATGENAEIPPSSRRPGRWLLLVATPILPGALFLIHPDGRGLDGLLPLEGTWLFLHVAVLPLLGLLGAVFYVLLDGYAGTPLDAVGMGLFLTGVAWIELRWRNDDEQHATQAT